MSSSHTTHQEIINAYNMWQFLPVGLFVVGENNRIVEANERIFKYFRLRKELLMGRQFGDVFRCHTAVSEKSECGEGSKCPLCPMRRAITQALGGSSDHLETELHHEFFVNGRKSVKWFAVNATHITQQNENHALIALTDVSSRKKRERELVQLGITDALTGLYNRRFIMQQLKSSLKSMNRNIFPISVAMLDIDDFKRVNDTLGHPAGDSVLSQFAEVFQKNTRDTDFVGRYGGEEFLMVFENSNAESTAKILSRIATRFRSVLKESLETPLTFSAGVVEIGQQSALRADVAAVIQKADDLLYEAKHKGKNQIAV